MKTIATVTAVNGSLATVETQRTSACEGCHKSEDGKGCSVCSLMGGDRKISTKADNRIGAEIGDRVTIESATGRMLWYAGLVFLLPLVIALVAYGVSTLFTTIAVWRLLGALIGFAGTFAGIFAYSKYIQKNRCDVIITEIVQKHGEE